MNRPQKRLCTAVAIGAVLVASLSAFSLRAAHSLDAKATEAAVTTLTTNILETAQFAHHPLDQELAEKFLGRYLDSLDGTRMLFLQSDVDEFAKYQNGLARSLHETGDNRPAHAIFARYLDRLQQRDEFIKAELQKGTFDFTGDEHFSYDRKDAKRPANLAAAQALWRTQLRSEYLQEKLAGKKPDEIAQTLARRADRTLQSMRKLSDDSVLEIYLEALAHVYDPHSDYMGREQTQSFQTAMNLSLVGIGASLSAEDGYCKIRELIPGGPAARGGQLKVGDRLVGVAQGNGNEFTDLVDLPLPQAVELIRGKKGTHVRLSIIPAGQADGAERKTITIMRDEVKLEDQQAKARIVDLPISNGGSRRMGVIDLPGFYAAEGKGAATSATADVARLLRKLQQEKVQGIILDLRRNGGGSLEEAINLTGLFIPGGPVVQTRDREGKVQVGRARASRQMYEGPLVVLISRFSASASEIVAGALQDYGRALIVGDSSTFGKGTVQTIVPLERVMQHEGLTPSGDPGALKVTISKFYRPSGQSTQLKGVRSDIVLPSPSDMPEIGESELLNPLPWDTISAAPGLKREDRVSAYLRDLRARSADRIGHDSDFAALQKEIGRVRAQRASKKLSLNEAERRQEKEEADARSKALKAARLARSATPPPTWELNLHNVDQAGLGEPLKNPATKTPLLALAEPVAGETDEPTPTDDLLLTETEHILGDYIDLLRNPALTKR